MNLKSNLLSLSAETLRAVNRTEEALPHDALDGPSSWDVWNAADAVTHCAAWLETDRKRLDDPQQIIPILSEEELEQINRDIFNTHKHTAWVDAKTHLTETVDRIRTRLDLMSDHQLRLTVKYSDGRERPLWWSLAGHLGLHVGWHIGILMRRQGMMDVAVAIVEGIVATSRTLSDDPRWLAANCYDLAVSYAQADRPLDALRELEASVAFNPAIREVAPEDEELKTLWERQDFRRLTGQTGSR
jgi:hypothetical protein